MSLSSSVNELLVSHNVLECSNIKWIYKRVHLEAEQTPDILHVQPIMEKFEVQQQLPCPAPAPGHTQATGISGPFAPTALLLICPLQVLWGSILWV